MGRRNNAVTGYHAIEEYIRRGKGATLWIVEGDSRGGKRVAALEQLARTRGVPVRRAADQARIAAECGLTAVDVQAARGVVLLLSVALPGVLEGDEGDAVSWPELGRRIAVLGEESLVVVLDGITDAHNLGAILRSADQFAAGLVMVPAHGSARRTETVGRISAGAAAHVSLVEVKNLSRGVELLKDAGFWVYGAEGGGESLSGCTFAGKTALVMGSEGKGIARLLRERCDKLVAIPTRGHIDSLNVSVAAGILMYEIRRQQWSADKPF